MKKFVQCASTGCSLPEEVATEIDALVLTLPTSCHYQKKAVNAGLQFEPGEERAEVSILTTNTVDKMNEVVLPSGIDLDSYRKSMVVLWQHDHDKPVASCKWIKLQGETLRAKTVYPPKPQGCEGEYLTDNAWVMIKSGVLKMKSIGFLPTEPMSEPTEQELEAHPDWQGAGIWRKTMLLEYSLTSCAVNNDALVEAITTKSLSENILKSLSIAMPPRPPKTLQELEAIVMKCKCGNGKKKPKPNIAKTFASLLEKIDLDIDRIAENAIEQYKNRGRV